MTRRRSIVTLITVTVVVIVFFVVLVRWWPQKSFSLPLFGSSKGVVSETVSVVRVVDGDTIEISGGEKVRYIGMNTPETVKQNWPVECFGKEASQENKALVEGKRVRLVRDVSDRDRYGRLLRYVYLEDGTFVNEVLVREGYAYATTFPPDVSKQAVFRVAELDARIAKRGLWALDTCNGKK